MSTTSPNMNLTIPTVGETVGPTYAQQINASLSLIDLHNHSSGNGVQITPSGLNINADLSFGSNNATSLRSSRYSAQSAPLALSTDVNCLYVSGVDLYYNDGNGNRIRVTASGGVNGTPGSITNLVSPASATYVSGSQTFVWQSNANVAANMDVGSVLLRNLTVSSNSVTLSPPSPIASSYTIVLPTLPASRTFLTIDNLGNMQAPLYDTTTLSVTPSLVSVVPGGLVDNVTTNVVASKIAVKNGFVALRFTANGPFGDVIATYPETEVDGRQIIPYNYQIMNVIVSLGTAAASSAVTFDILKNGTSIFSTLPSFAATYSGNTDSGSLFPSATGITKPIVSSANLTAGDVLTMSITAANLGAANAEITLIVSQR